MPFVCVKILWEDKLDNSHFLPITAILLLHAWQKWKLRRRVLVHVQTRIVLVHITNMSSTSCADLKYWNLNTLQQGPLKDRLPHENNKTYGLPCLVLKTQSTGRSAYWADTSALLRSSSYVLRWHVRIWSLCLFISQGPLKFRRASSWEQKDIISTVIYMGDTEHRKIWPLGGYFSAIKIAIMNTFCVGTCAFGRFVSSFRSLHQMTTINSTLLFF